MDLLAGYGSDDSEQGDEQASPHAPNAADGAPAPVGMGTGLANLPPPQLSGDSAGPGRSGLFAQLPPPSTDAGGGGFSSAGLSAAGFGLAPAAGAKPGAKHKPAGRKVVQLRTMKPLAGGDSDEVQTVCRSTTSDCTHRDRLSVHIDASVILTLTAVATCRHLV